MTIKETLTNIKAYDGWDYRNYPLTKEEAETIIDFMSWVSVKDRLPTDDDTVDNEVLCFNKYGDYLIGYICEDNGSDSGYRAENDTEEMDEVIAWMPLPGEYKEENNDR